MQRYDVAIIGGGHVGLLCALNLSHEIALKKSSPASIVLVDQVTPGALINAQNDGRTFALTNAAYGLLKKLNIWPDIEPIAEPILDIMVTEQNNLSGVHYDHKSIGAPFGYIVESTQLRRVLLSHLESQKCINLRTPLTLKNYSQEAHSLMLEFEEGETFSTRLLIGSDGRASRVRDLMGVASQPLAYTQQALVCHVAHTHPHRGWAIEAFYPEGPFAVLPMRGTEAYPHQSGLVWCGDQDTIKNLQQSTNEDFNRKLSTKMDSERYGISQLMSPRWVYPLSALVVPKCIKPRVVLIGDAAHGIHPVAGQGLNLGIRDIVELSDVVSQSLSLGLDPGSHHALTKYQKSRRVDVLSLLTVTHGLIHLFSNESKILKSLRNFGLHMVDHVSPLKEFFIKRAMGKGA